MRHFIFRYLTSIIVVLFLAGLDFITAQEGSEILVILDSNSITIFIRNPAATLLEGIGFTQGGTQRILFLHTLENYTTFQSATKPACLQLVSDNRNLTWPSECSGATHLRESIPAADVFWASDGQLRAFAVVGSAGLSIYP